MKKNNLTKILNCPICNGNFSVRLKNEKLDCDDCNNSIPIINQKPHFISINSDVHVFEKRDRGPNIGTPWRKANWKFLEKQLVNFPTDAKILDVGSGRGDFQQIFRGFDYYSLDVYPYPEVKIVADLTISSPIKPNSIDLVVLMNVLEHVFDTRVLLTEIRRLLKPGGTLLIAVPFLIKVHQAPYDFVRYTEYSLRRWAKIIDYDVILLEGYYDPIFLLDQGLGNLRYGTAPGLPKLKRVFVYFCLKVFNLLKRILQFVIGNGYVSNPESEISPAPIGYHIVLRKNP